MHVSVPIGLLIATATEPERIADTAHRAEDHGFDEVWVAEESFGYGAFAGAALALAATTRVRVGLGIVSDVSRHPAVTAMEIATLARAFPGRFVPGIGHGPAWRLGLEPVSSLAALEESVTSIRRLLRGETVDHVGRQFTFRSVTLPHRLDPVPPVLTGVMRPRSLALSGRIADGTIMSVLAGPEYLREARRHIAKGAHALPTFVLCAVHRDGQRALAQLRPVVAYYLSRIGAANPLAAAYGYTSALTHMLQRGGLATLEREMPDSWVTNLAAVGDPDQVRATLAEFVDAGATSLVLVPPIGHTHEQAQLISELVLDHPQPHV